MSNLESGVAAKTKTDAVSRTQRGRQFHQRKTRESGGNIVNGCRVAVQLEKKSQESIEAECRADTSRGRWTHEPCTHRQVSGGKKGTVSVVMSSKNRWSFKKKKNRRRTKERTKVFMVTRGHRQSKRGKKNVEKKQSTNNLNSHQKKL